MIEDDCNPAARQAGYPVGEEHDPDPPALEHGAGRDLTCQPYPVATATPRGFNRAGIAGLIGLDWYRGAEYLVTDQLGMPVHPEWYSDEFGRLLKRIGLRRITLHDSRHTTLTLMEHAGVPISIVSKRAGHYDAAFTQRTYVHASNDDLEQGRKALARIHRIA